MKSLEFEKLVRDAITTLPRHIGDAMENVVFVVEKEPRRRKAKEVGIKINETLLGLYEGVPLTGRGSGYSGVLPDKITIFQNPIEELSGGDANKLKILVLDVVRHEVGHYFGFDEEELLAIENKRKQK